MKRRRVIRIKVSFVMKMEMVKRGRIVFFRGWSMGVIEG
jgi:hypothetical protein